MANRYLGGERPAPRPGSHAGPVWADAPRAQYRRALEGCLLHEALAALWEFVGEANRFVDAEQPWELAKAAKAGETAAEERLRGVLGDLVEACRLLGLAAAPFLPATAPRVLAQLGYDYPYAADGNGGPPILDELRWGAHAAEAGRVAARSRCSRASTSIPRRADPTRCASSTATAISRPTRSTVTSTGARWRPIGRRRADPRSGLGSGVVSPARWRSPIDFPGSTSRSASIPTTPPNVDEAAWAEIVALAADPRVVAIGETGLDYDRRLLADPRTARRTCAATSRLAVETGKPAILHCRSARASATAQDALLQRAARRSGARPAGASSSTPTPVRSTTPRRCSSWAPPSASPGSCSGAARRRRPRSPRLAPPDRILVETDSPFLSPPGAPRRRNEPEWVARDRGLGRRAAGHDDAVGEQLVANYDAAWRPLGAWHDLGRAFSDRPIEVVRAPWAARYAVANSSDLTPAPPGTVLALSHREC